MIIPKAPLIAGAVVVLILVAIGATIISVFSATRPAADAASNFLADIASKGPDKAYLEAAPALRANQSQAAFDASIASMRLVQFKNASWSTREINGDTASVGGTVELTSGGKVPVTVDLIKQDRLWLVIEIRYGVAPSSLPGD